jgi:riboflavin synthase
MAETLNRSSLSKVAIGSKVNLERAARIDARIGGHLVQGHVDAVASVLAIEPNVHWTLIRFTLPVDLAKYLVEKGSITVDGVSLTIVEAGPDHFTVSLIPTTLGHTTLGGLTVGDIVNLEVDVIAKYVERLMKGDAK